MAEARYLVDVRKAACAAYPKHHVIIDSHAGDAIVALCPIAEGNEPVFEGQYSFAPLVQRALEREAHARAALSGLPIPDLEGFADVDTNR